MTQPPDKPPEHPGNKDRLIGIENGRKVTFEHGGQTINGAVSVLRGVTWLAVRKDDAVFKVGAELRIDGVLYEVIADNGSPTRNMEQFSLLTKPEPKS